MHAPTPRPPRPKATLLSASGAESAFAADMGRMLQRLGVVSVRTTLVDADTLAHQSGWAFYQGGEAAGDGLDEQPLDSSFPGASATIARVEASSLEDTVTQRLSPRRWVLGWRVDDQHVVMALVHFQEGHLALEPNEVALVRLAADAGLHSAPTPGTGGAPAKAAKSRAEPESGAGTSSSGATAATAASAASASPGKSGRPSSKASAGGAATWPMVERRRKVLLRWISWPAWLLAGVAALLCAWITAVVVPQVHAENAQREMDEARLRAMADTTLVRSVGAALATGDYGEVQAVLDSFAQQGYFRQAVVTNARQRVVASVGAISGVRIGDAPPAELLQQARVTELMQGAEPNGRLMLQRAEPTTPPEGRALRLVQVLASLALACAGATAALIISRVPGRRPKLPRPRRPDSAPSTSRRSRADSALPSSSPAASGVGPSTLSGRSTRPSRGAGGPPSSGPSNPSGSIGRP